MIVNVDKNISGKAKNGVSKLTDNYDISNDIDENQVEQIENDEFFDPENDLDYFNDEVFNDDENTEDFSDKNTDNSNDKENVDFLNDDATFDVEEGCDEEVDFEEFGILSPLFVINQYKVVILFCSFYSTFYFFVNW